MSKNRTERILEPIVIDNPKVLARFKAIMELSPYGSSPVPITEAIMRERDEFVERRTAEILVEMLQEESLED